MRVQADEQDRQNSLALAKILTIAAIKIKGGKIVDLKQSIANNIYNNALSFLEEYSGDTKADTIFQSLWSNILKKSADVEPFVLELVPALRAMIRQNDLKSKLDVMSTDTKEVLNPVLAFLSDPNSLNKFDVVVRKSNLLKEPTITNKLVLVFKELADSSVRIQETTDPDDYTDHSKDIGKPGAGVETMQLLLKKIVALGKQLTGRNNVTKLTQEEKAKLNEIPKNKPLIREFNSLRSQLTNVKKNEVRNIVVQSGKTQIPVRDMVKGLKLAGNTSISIPKGLQNSTIVYINTNGEYCDKDGRVCVKQTADPTAVWADNPKYSPTGAKGAIWLVKVTTASGTNYFGTKARIAENRAQNFEKIGSVLEQGIETAKAAWRADMNADFENERTVYAYITEYMFWTASRVGSAEGRTEGSRTYGATNFLVSHILDLPKTGKAPARLTLKYPVKSGAETTFVLSSNVGDLPNKEDAQYIKRLISFIAAKAKGKKPDDVVFTIAGKRVNTDKLNGYLKTNLGNNFTAKNFRTLRGSELAIVALEAVGEEFVKQQSALQKKGKKLPQKTVDQLFDVAMKAVGELLGHVRRQGDDGEPITTSSTAIRSYIAPQIMLDFFNQIGYAPNARVISAARAAGVPV